MVHGDGQYAPEELPTLVAPLRDGQADAVFGSRMMTGFGALKGGMPLYKFVGNKILTASRTCCSAPSCPSSTAATASTRSPRCGRFRFRLNSNDFPLRHRDHHPAAQRRPAHRRAADPDLLRRRDLPRQRHEVREGRRWWRPCRTSPTGRGSALSAPLRPALAEQDNAHYDLKLGYASSHQFALDAVPPGRVGARHRRGPGRHRRRARAQGLRGGGRRSVHARRTGSTPTVVVFSRTSTPNRRSTSVATTTCCCSTSSST